MARAKKTIRQADFALMEVREEFLERDDVEARQRSVRNALNMRALATGAAAARPGLLYKRVLTDADDIIEIVPEAGLKFGLVLNDTSFDIVNSDGDIMYSDASVPWTDASDLWVEPAREKTLIGGNGVGIYILTYSAGSWSLDEFAFTDAPGDEKAQPYWAFEPDTTIEPSGTTGTITLKASEPIWEAGHVGIRVRYNFREVLITSVFSSTIAIGFVVNDLPPSFRLTVADVSEFREGEAVVGSDTGYEGIIVSINSAANTMDVTTLEFFDGPDSGENISGPTATQKITSKADIAPLASTVWDEQLISYLRGHPRAAGFVSGRLILLDFPLVPDLVAISSARQIEDFEVGTEDDDAIVRQLGGNSPRFLHAINAGDLLLFSDRGCYYVPTRDNGVITPQTFNAVLFDDRGANDVRPVRVNDGVVFVDASGENVSAALLDGNVYLKWSIRSLTTFHSHLINAPRKLCGPSLSSGDPERYVFVVNADGTLAAVSYQQDLGSEAVGFAPWETEGTFINVAPIFGGYWAIVDRVTSGGTVRFLEAFSNSTYLDCAVDTSTDSTAETLADDGGDEITDDDDDPIAIESASMAHIPGMTVAVYQGGYYVGGLTVAADGTIDDTLGFSGARQIGIDFTARMDVWPVEYIESPYLGMLKARVTRFAASVQSTGTFKILTNRTERIVGGYSAGDDLSAPPPLRTKVFKAPVFGTKDHPDMAVIKHEAGPFRVLALTQEVQG